MELGGGGEYLGQNSVTIFFFSSVNGIGTNRNIILS